MFNRKILKGLCGIVVTLAMGACATGHKENFANWVDEEGNVLAEGINKKVDGLRISGEMNMGMSTDHFVVMDLTFENLSDEWVKLDRPQISFSQNELNKTINVPTGERLSAWGEGIQNKVAVAQYNEALVLGSIALAGGVAAASSNNNSTKAIGAGAYLGSLTFIAVEDLNRSREKVESANMNPNTRLFPDSHLYGGNLNIPPGLFLRRFVVLSGKQTDKLAKGEKVLIKYDIDNNPRLVQIML